ncbi:SDR family oxidoreductase [Mesonia aestuariivivens]|uniref:SDR family oxidoreductase n=1 Tax=Mesonia aestuariivivens TaxID=2796128 RepID=A0ABS6W2V2_9FLAO|nr:SDR family oxidoreductase [Mesonia aestuariivivens]MBW2962183.1 SDR family oxidoreductase [Mesonia aestuariivivens]
MKILLTGANGYIGMRLLPLLLEQGHQVICAVRSADRLSVDPEVRKEIEIVEIDFLKEVQHNILPKDIDAAYYLIHSMTTSTKDFDEKEAQAAKNFNAYLETLNVKQVIFLTGMTNDNESSKHLSSREEVGKILQEGNFHLTRLQAGIVVGSGSSSFEIIRDLCEKLPFMITPRWVDTKTQPIAIRNVLQYLSGVLGNEKCYDEVFDIGGPEVLTYKKMMLQYSKIRGLRLHIFGVPFMTPRLSSYWLYFVTSTSYKLAVNLVDSMTVEVTSKDKRLQNMLGIKPISYEKAIEMAFDKIEQNQVISSWKDSKSSGRYKQKDLNKYVQVPMHGCLKDSQQQKADDPDESLEKIWSIGGKNGWYYADTLWKFRGFLDKLFGGVGLRRGRTHFNKINTGDSLDFWRVLLADKENKRLLLFAEMRVPGEAWLEFCIDDEGIVHQTATFRPKGLAGRAYWYSMLPFHFFIFKGMLNEIAKSSD